MGDAEAPPEELDPESDPALRDVAGPSDADAAAKAMAEGTLTLTVTLTPIPTLTRTLTRTARSRRPSATPRAARRR